MGLERLISVNRTVSSNAQLHHRKQSGLFLEAIWRPVLPWVAGLLQKQVLEFVNGLVFGHLLQLVVSLFGANATPLPVLLESTRSVAVAQRGSLQFSARLT